MHEVYLLAWYTSTAQADAARAGVLAISNRPDEIFDDEFRKVSWLDPHTKGSGTFEYITNPRPPNIYFDEV